MHSSDFLTAEVMMHLSRLAAMTKPTSELEDIMLRANAYLNKVICNEVRDIQNYVRKGGKPYFPSYICLQHLYNCALRKRTLTKDVSEAYQYLVRLLKQDIFNQTIREKAMSALILEYNGEHKRALLYAESLYQYTSYEEEKGRWFDTPRASYSWMSYKIPTHVLAMEALCALRPDDMETIEQMKIWLLQEKRTQLWDTPIDCVNAVHALLLGNRQLIGESISSAESVSITADGKPIEAEPIDKGRSLRA